MAVSLLILNRFSNFFTVRFSSKFAAKCSLKIPPHLICVAIVPSETKHWWQKMSDRRNAAINDKLLCTVVTYLNCGRITNNQILKKDSLLSLTVKKIKIGEWHSYWQKGGLCCALSSIFSSVWLYKMYTRQPPSCL